MRLNKKYKGLSKKDLIDLIEVINSCSSCNNETEFLRIIEKLKELVLFECSLFDYINQKNLLSGKNISEKTLSYTYPEDYLDRYYKEQYYYIDVPVIAFLQTSKIQNISESIFRYNNGFLNKVETELLDCGLNDGWIYGMPDKFGNYCFIFSLIGAQIENNKRTKRILNIITPFLAESYKNLLRTKENQSFALTTRELEVLNWIKDGKTSWEISKILNTSKRTIDFHTNNCVYKLNAANRTNAVAIALNNNLIQF